MDKKTILWIVIAVLAVVVLYITFFKGSGTGQVVTSGKLDTTGWTENEIMNYEMHGTVPARIQQGSGSSSASSGMVGGC